MEETRTPLIQMNAYQTETWRGLSLTQEEIWIQCRRSRKNIEASKTQVTLLIGQTQPMSFEVTRLIVLLIQLRPKLPPSHHQMLQHLIQPSNQQTTRVLHQVLTQHFPSVQQKHQHLHHRNTQRVTNMFNTAKFFESPMLENLIATSHARVIDSRVLDNGNAVMI